MQSRLEVNKSKQLHRIGYHFWQAAMLGSLLVRSDPSVFTSLVRNSMRTELKSM